MEIKQQKKQFVLRGGTILDPLDRKSYRGDVFIENGKIRSVGEVKVKSAVDEIDCSGLMVTHGFCDIHAHFREPGREDKETLATGARAALAGGFTRVCIMPNTTPPIDTPESIRFIIEKALDLPVHLHPIGAVTKGQKGKEMTEMGAMKAEGAVAFSDDGIPIADGQVMRLALEYSSMFDVPIINHAEDLCLRNDGIMNEGSVATRLGLPGNPDIAESMMVHRDLELARWTGSRLHVPHVSTGKAVEVIRTLRTDSQKITAEITPHHLYFNDEALLSFNTNLKVAPPIRSEEDRRALITAIKEGVIDCIATDHAPHTIEEKEKTFDLAPFGMIGLESCFGVVNKVLVLESKLALMDLIALLTTGPRKVMGFNLDLFSGGTEAELIIFDPNINWIFTTANIYSRSKNSPFIGETLLGKPKYVIAKGIVAEID